MPVLGQLIRISATSEVAFPSTRRYDGALDAISALVAPFPVCSPRVRSSAAFVRSFSMSNDIESDFPAEPCVAGPTDAITGRMIPHGSVGVILRGIKNPMTIATYPRFPQRRKLDSAKRIERASTRLLSSVTPYSNRNVRFGNRGCLTALASGRPLADRAPCQRHRIGGKSDTQNQELQESSSPIY
jgi:hypothetical protein